MSKKLLRFLRHCGFALLILLALAGIALPIPLYTRDKKEDSIEQIDENNTDSDDDIYKFDLE